MTNDDKCVLYFQVVLSTLLLAATSFAAPGPYRDYGGYGATKVIVIKQGGHRGHYGHHGGGWGGHRGHGGYGYEGGYGR